MRALIIGRFQPFHMGHLQIVIDVAKNHDSIIIGIGSAQESHTLENPFTAGERHLMISRTLETNGLTNYFLVPIEDIHRNAVWVSHVESIAPPFQIVYTANPLNKRLFIEKGYIVRMPFLYDRKKFSGTEIRKRIIKNEGWEMLVPKEVMDVIKEIDGINRLKNLSEPDEE